MAKQVMIVIAAVLVACLMQVNASAADRSPMQVMGVCEDGGQLLAVERPSAGGSYEVEGVCPSGETARGTFECRPGKRVAAYLECPGQEQFYGCYIVCPDRDVTQDYLGYLDNEVEGLKREVGEINRFDWSLGTRGFGLGVFGGPASGGLEGVLDIRFQMTGDWWFDMDFGGGFATYEDEVNPSLTGAVGISWRPGNVSIGIAFRDRLVFNGDGDQIHALLAEPVLAYQVTDWLTVDLSGGLGGAWWREFRSAPNNPTVKESRRALGTVWTTSVGVSLEF